MRFQTCALNLMLFVCTPQYLFCPLRVENPFGFSIGKPVRLSYCCYEIMGLSPR